MTSVCSVKLVPPIHNFHAVPALIKIHSLFPPPILHPQAPFFIWRKTATGAGEHLQQARASLEQGLRGGTIVFQGPQQPSARQHQIQHEADAGLLSKWTSPEVGPPEEG